MHPVHIPTSDVNSEYGIVVRWHCADRQPVAAGQPLVDLETSKAVIEVAVPAAGVLLRLVHEEDEIPLTEPVALLFDDAEALAAYEATRPAAHPAPMAAAQPTSGSTPFASAKATARAAELGVDLTTLDRGRLITVDDVERAAGATPTHGAALPALEPRPVRPGVQRLVLIGGGRGAEVVVDMLATNPRQEAVALLDDDAAKWGHHIAGVPVLGGIDRLTELVTAGEVDAAVIPISASAALRAGWRAACRAAGLPLANVVDPTARIASNVVLGEGNVIGAHCNIGTGTRIGHNNLLSAFTSFDHHNVIGSEISTGPGCLTSGSVTIGDGVTLGTGVFIEPHLTLGDGVQVASGAVVLTSVPAHHAVKTRTFTTSVVPLRNRPA